MIKRALLLCALCAVVFIFSCIDSATVISVRKDGSGTITEVVYLSESVKTMMQGMMAQMEVEEGEKDQKLFDIEKYKTKATKLGSGVKFVSAKEVTTKDGSSGIQVVYSFDDIRKLNIQAEPENPMGDEMAGMMEAEPAAEEENPITFDFVPGAIPRLIITMPKKEEPESSEEIPEETTEEPEAAAAGMGMMKQFLEGFRIRVMVNLLEGKIQKTNASFVETVDGKETVTLLDVALGEIMKNEKYAKEWQGMSQIKDMSKAMEKMKNIPGLKIETAERVEISFK